MIQLMNLSILHADNFFMLNCDLSIYMCEFISLNIELFKDFLDDL